MGLSPRSMLRTVVSALPSRPTMKKPASLHLRSACTRLVTRAAGTRAAAPADTFHAVTPTPALRRSGRIKPSAPNAAPERRMAPTLWGSVMWSRATSKPGLYCCRESMIRSSRSEYSYSATSTAMPWCAAPSLTRSRSRFVTSINGAPVSARSSKTSRILP